MMMKTVFALSAFFLSSVAAAACYQIFSPSGVLVWQGNQPPVAMDNPSLGDEVKRIVPGGHLVIVEGQVPCRALDTTGKNPREDDWKKTATAE
jgi:hypothetical protein